MFLQYWLSPGPYGPNLDILAASWAEVGRSLQALGPFLGPNLLALGPYFGAHGPKLAASALISAALGSKLAVLGPKLGALGRNEVQVGRFLGPLQPSKSGA